MYRRLFVFVLTAPILLTTSIIYLVTTTGTVEGAADTASAQLAQLGSEIEVSWFDAEQYLPAVTYNTNLQEFFIVWHSKGTDNGHRRLFATRLDMKGGIVSQFVVAYSPTANDRAQASVAYDPVNRQYLVVWTEDVNGDDSDWDIYGAFVPENYVSQTITPFAINQYATSQWNPRVVYASGAQEYFVVWTNTYAAGTPPAYISGRRIRANGTFPSATADLTIADTVENQTNPDIVYNSVRNEYLVVWEKVGTDRDIYGLRLTSAGAPVGAEFGIAGWPGFEERPTAAYCDGPDQYLVAWQSLQSGSEHHIYGRVVSGEGVPGQVGLIYGTTVDEAEPSAACATTGQHYLVTWEQQYSNTAGPYGIWGREVNTNMGLGELTTLVTPTAGQVDGKKNPFVAAGGTGYFVAWEHEVGANSGHGIYGRLVHNETIFLPLVIR